MKIHRVVQMLGATTSTGKLADDMYDLGHKDYYSEAQDRYIPISHMDFQHMVRAFVKQNDEDVRTDTQEGKVKELKQSLDSSHRAYKMGFERNGRHIERIKELELENQRLVQRLEHDETVVSKEAYQVMWDNCEKLKEDLKKTDNIVENNDKIYKKNLAELQDKYDELRKTYAVLLEDYNTDTGRGIWKERYEKEVDNAEYWKAQYRIANDLLQPNKGCGYAFSEIPNDTDGQEFVDTMKQYLNKDSYKMRVRGQHIKPELRGTGATYWGQSKAESTHMRIYIDKKKGE